MSSLSIYYLIDLESQSGSLAQKGLSSRHKRPYIIQRYIPFLN